MTNVKNYKLKKLVIGLLGIAIGILLCSNDVIGAEPKPKRLSVNQLEFITGCKIGVMNVAKDWKVLSDVKEKEVYSTCRALEKLVPAKDLKELKNKYYAGCGYGVMVLFNQYGLLFNQTVMNKFCKELI